MEKHWKSVIHRSVCDYFFEAQKKCNKPEDIPTVISTPHNKLILIYRNKLYFVAVVVNEGKTRDSFESSRTASTLSLSRMHSY